MALAGSTTVRHRVPTISSRHSSIPIDRLGTWLLERSGVSRAYALTIGGYGGGEAGDESNGTVEEKRVGWAFCLRMKLVSYVCAEFNSASKLLNWAVL